MRRRRPRAITGAGRDRGSFATCSAPPTPSAASRGAPGRPRATRQGAPAIRAAEHAIREGGAAAAPAALMPPTESRRSCGAGRRVSAPPRWSARAQGGRRDPPTLGPPSAAPNTRSGRVERRRTRANVGGRSGPGLVRDVRRTQTPPPASRGMPGGSSRTVTIRSTIRGAQHAISGGGATALPAAPMPSRWAGRSYGRCGAFRRHRGGPRCSQGGRLGRSPLGPPSVPPARRRATSKWRGLLRRSSVHLICAY